MKKTVTGLLMTTMIFLGVSFAGNITVEEKSSISSCTASESIDKYLYLSPEYEVSDKPWDTFKNTVDSLIKKGNTSVQIWRNGVIADCDDWNTSSIVVSSLDTNGASIIINKDGCDFKKPNYTKSSNPSAIDAQIHYTIGYARVRENGTKLYNGKLYYKDYTDQDWTCYPGGNKVTNNQSCPNVSVKYVDETKYHKGECINYRVFRCGDGLVNGRDKNGSKITIYDNNVNYNEACDPESPDWKNRTDGKACNAKCEIVEPAAPVCESAYNNQTRYTDTSTPKLNGTESLCRVGNVTNFTGAGAPRVFTWKCDNYGSATGCTATQQRCGDGVIQENKEDCDDGNKNGTSSSTCSKTCKVVGDVSCGTADKGTTYFIGGKQTTSWLTKTSAGMCGDGLTVGIPYITGSDNHVEWTCSNTNGSEKICKAYQEYCGDGKYQSDYEQCDYNDDKETNRGNDGCSMSCQQKNEVVSECDEKHTYYRKLRHLSGYIFEDNFSAGDGDRRLYGSPDVKFEEKMDYNKGVNPTFNWTNRLIKNDMKVPAGERRLIVESAPEYVIKEHPTTREKDNLYIEYTLKYANKKYSTTPDDSKLKTHKECVYYEISRCGDGTLDTEYGEECDPEATPWKFNGTCDPVTCKEKDYKGGLKVEKTLISKSKVITKTGQEVKWEIKVTAMGGDVKDVKITDKLPPVLDYVEGLFKSLPSGVTVSKIDQPTFSANKREVYWQTKGVLGSGESIVLEVTTKANAMPKATDDYKNVACAEATGVDKECNPAKLPGLRIKKYILDGNTEVKTKTVKIGDEIVYKIKFGNNGDADATITSIKDFLPKNVKYISSEIHINRSSNHGSDTQKGEEEFKGFKVVDGVYIDIYGGLTLNSGDEGYIIIKGEILSDNPDNRTNFACIYLNDDVVDCDDAVHVIDSVTCDQLEVVTKTINIGGSTQVSCSTKGGKAKNIKIDCGNGDSVLSTEDSDMLTGICSYKTAGTYYPKCVVNGIEPTPTACTGTVKVKSEAPACVHIEKTSNGVKCTADKQSYFRLDCYSKGKSYIYDKELGKSYTFAQCEDPEKSTCFVKNEDSGWITSDDCYYESEPEEAPECEYIQIKGSDGVKCTADKPSYFKLSCDGDTYKYENKLGKSYTFTKCKNPEKAKCFVRNNDSSDWKSSRDCKYEESDDRQKTPYCEKHPDDPICNLAEAKCFNVNAGNISIEKGEILPFYLNISKDLSKRSDEYNYVYLDPDKYPMGDMDNYKKILNNEEMCSPGAVILNSMICEYVIMSRDANTDKKEEIFRGKDACLDGGESFDEAKPLIKSWIDWQNKTYGKMQTVNDADGTSYTYAPKIGYTNSNDWWDRLPNLGEYEFKITNVKYLQCDGDGKWMKGETDAVCQSNLVLTEPYTVQKTPSGNLTASTEVLGKFQEVDGSRNIRLSEYLNTITTSDYKANTKVKQAMDDFIDKYKKLAVSVTKDGKEMKKVPGKNIYFTSDDFRVTKGDFTTPFTIVQTDPEKIVTIDGDSNLNMMILTRGNIVFKSNCKTNQNVKGIFYAEGDLKRDGVGHNYKDRLNVSQWCDKGGLKVKGVLIGDNFKQLMKDSRSHLESWFNADGSKTSNKQELTKKVMDGASVVIEYSPSIFTKSTMPPGAEDFTTALSIYKN